MVGIQSLEYYWVATYKDGTQVKQFNSREETMFSEIDQSRIDTFSWTPFDESKPSFTLKIKPWQRLIALRQHRFTTGKEMEEPIVYLLGWQATINRKNYKTMIAILPDGNVIFGDGSEVNR